MKYIQIKFSDLVEEQSDILIALLADIGFEGFEENENELKAFIAETTFDKENLELLANGNRLSYSLSEIEQQNWNAQWESSFEPVIINNFAAVRAGFHQPVQNVQYQLIITPKMSFGTGHHATTYLVIEQMSHLNFTDRAVMDFGTGTGVLAILAQKMGATTIKAIDNDDWSIDNAKENIANNDANNIVIEKAETFNAAEKYDIILANINLNVILQSMAAIASLCKPGAEILLSGFLITDKEKIIAALSSNKLIFNDFWQQKDWICVKASCNK